MLFTPFTHTAALLPLAICAAVQNCASEEDRVFLTELYLRFRRQLFTCACRICDTPQDAEDAVQNTFLSLIPHVSDLRSMQKDQLRGYVFITLKNEARMILRKERRIAHSEAGCLSADAPEQDVLPMTGYAIQDLMDALTELSERDQALLQMKYFLRESDQAIAERMDVKVGSVSTLVRRARKRLVQILETGGDCHGG